jgi:hypothetical protein
MVNPQDLSGEVTINDSPSKSKLYRFCEKKIDQWIQSKTAQSHAVNSAAFRVSFSDEDDGEQVSCVTEIHLGGSLWRGCEHANDTQRAFIHSLKRLKPH